MKISVITLCAQLLSLLLSAHTVRAQSRRVGITPLAASRHSIIVEMALEPELVVSLDYIYGLGALDRRNGISVGAGVSAAKVVIGRHWRWNLFIGDSLCL